MTEGNVDRLSRQRLLKASEVAQILNISKAFAYKLMKTGALRAVQIEGARRVREQDLEAYIENNIQPKFFA